MSLENSHNDRLLVNSQLVPIEASRRTAQDAVNVGRGSMRIPCLQGKPSPRGLAWDS